MKFSLLETLSRGFPDRPAPRRFFAMGCCFAAFTVAGLVPAQAGLIIVAIEGDIDTPSPNVAGGGNITTIFNQAVLNWQAAYPDPAQEWTVTMTYHWAMLGTDLVAQFTDPVVDEETGRILAGTVTFNNSEDLPISWFADPNPELVLNNPFFDSGPVVTNWEVDAGGEIVELNMGTGFVATPGSLADGRVDLLTIAMHEIGHGLGLLFSPPTYETPHPLRVTEDVSPFYAGHEILVNQGEHLSFPSLMARSTDPGLRFYPSSNDILAMATISDFHNPTLNPYNIPGIPVPEPSSLAFELAGLALLGWRRRWKRRPF